MILYYKLQYTEAIYRARFYGQMIPNVKNIIFQFNHHRLHPTHCYYYYYNHIIVIRVRIFCPVFFSTAVIIQQYYESHE